MPVSRSLSASGGARLALSTLLGVGAILCVVLVLLAATTLMSTANWPAKAPTNPFGYPLRDAAPSTNGLGGMILTLQAQFYSLLTQALAELKSKQSGVLSLMSIGFAYGIFHAAGPGHGKGVVGAYILANRSGPLVAVFLSTSAAILQALVAIGIVGSFAFYLSGSRITVGAFARSAEIASFAAIALLGGFLTFKKAGELTEQILSAGSAEKVDGLEPRRKRSLHWSWVILAAGIRPCSGALLLLAFALSQDLFIAGVAGALAMAGGTAITTSALAVLASIGREGLARLTSGGKRRSAIMVNGLELAAAAFVVVFGSVLLSGLSTSGFSSFID